MNGLQDVGLPLVAGLLLACSDVCADGKVQECEDVLTIVFDAPLRFEGAYSLEITGPFEVSCSFAYPISTSPACTNAIPIVANGDIAGLTIEGSVVLVVRLNGAELLQQAMTPAYRKPGDDCGHGCQYASEHIATAGLEDPSGAGGASGAGGTDAGGGA